MSYAEMYQVYDDPDTRNRGLMCIREQAAIYVNDGRLDIAALGQGVVRGQYGDIYAIWSAVTAGPNYATLTEDLALLSAVQGVWPAVADALYSHLITVPELEGGTE